jgi:hypothetical protein
MAEEQPTRNPAGELTWRTSYSIVVLIALSIGALSIVSSLGIDWMMHGAIRRTYASDWFDGAAVALLSSLFLTRLQAQRRALMVRMQIVEDVNHHVRNALTSIVLSASLHEDPELNARIKDACDRIDWVLSDVLSQSVNATDLKAEHPAWKAGRQLDQSNPTSQSPPQPAQTKNMRN